MKFEVHQLAARLGLLKQLKNPKVVALLEAHLEEIRKIEQADPPLEFPKKRPGAANSGRYLVAMEALRSRKD
jgi:hypothetical protein